MRTAALVLAAIACLGAATPAGVVAVYPSASEIPANLLRVSIRFARPPTLPVLPRLSLHGAALDPGRPPFLDQELWSPNGQVLTVLFDPARLKTGVAANLEFGRVLRAGQTVTLDLDDAPVKRWRVAAALLAGPDPGKWMLHPAPPGSRDPLVVRFDHAVDALDGGLLAVVAADGALVRGAGRLGVGETVWRFTPEQPWRLGQFRLLVSPALEDASGNSVAQPFEAVGIALPAPRQPVAIPFAIGPLL